MAAEALDLEIGGTKKQPQCTEGGGNAPKERAAITHEEEKANQQLFSGLNVKRFIIAMVLRIVHWFCNRRLHIFCLYSY